MLCDRLYVCGSASALFFPLPLPPYASKRLVFFPLSSLLLWQKPTENDSAKDRPFASKEKEERG